MTIYQGLCVNCLTTFKLLEGNTSDNPYVCAKCNAAYWYDFNGSTRKPRIKIDYNYSGPAGVVGEEPEKDTGESNATHKIKQSGELVKVTSSAHGWHTLDDGRKIRYSRVSVLD